MIHEETNVPAITLEKINTLMDYDEAFTYSVVNKDTHNMRIVLRAYGYAYTSKQAERVIRLCEIGYREQLMIRRRASD